MLKIKASLLAQLKNDVAKSTLIYTFFICKFNLHKQSKLKNPFGLQVQCACTQPHKKRLNILMMQMCYKRSLFMICTFHICFKYSNLMIILQIGGYILVKDINLYLSESSVLSSGYNSDK